MRQLEELKINNFVTGIHLLKNLKKLHIEKSLCKKMKMIIKKLQQINSCLVVKEFVDMEEVDWNFY